MSRFCIVLVRPRDPNNIGACARAMGNFGFDDLRVVNPYAPVWREAVSAVGARDIMQSARVYSSLDEALADTQFSLAATALKNRDVKQSVYFLPELDAWLDERPHGQTALVFGNEKTGLSNEDIARCDAVLNIPTAAKQPSVNLAQAVLLTCYQIAHFTGLKPLRCAPAPALPTREQKELLIDQADRLLAWTRVKTDLPAEARRALLRRILSAQHLTRDQLFFLKKLIGKINEKAGS